MPGFITLVVTLAISLAIAIGFAFTVVGSAAELVAGACVIMLVMRFGMHVPQVLRRLRLLH